MVSKIVKISYGGFFLPLDRPQSLETLLLLHVLRVDLYEVDLLRL